MKAVIEARWFGVPPARTVNNGVLAMTAGLPVCVCVCHSVCNCVCL